MPASCQNLFDDSRHSPSSVGIVYNDISVIFREHWKPLISICSLNILSFIGASFLLGIFVAAVFADLFAVFSHGWSDSQDQMSAFDFEAFSYTLQKYSGQIFVTLITIITVMSLVTCTFVGAMAHTVAEAYSGGTPGTCTSIRFGWDHKWQIFKYQIVVLFPFTVFMCMITSIATVIFLSYLVAFAYFIFFGTVMVAGIPAIIVEGMSSIAAIRRSYNLCKSEFCFVFCNIFCFQLLMLIFTIVMNAILSIFPDVISFWCRLGINILVSVMGSILPLAIYMSIRIRNENYTREDLCQELSGSKPIVMVTEVGTFKRVEVV